MTDITPLTWYPAKNEKNVFGRFAYYDIVDIPASKAADEKRYKQILVLHTKSAGEIDIPAPIKVHPENQMELVHRFPDAWTAWEGGLVQLPGTPLDALGLGADQLLGMRIFGVTRMEHLANLSDQQCENMGFGIKSLRNKARELLGAPAVAPTPPAPVAEAAPGMTQADFDRRVAEAVAAALAARPVVPQLAPKRRGRPPKAKPAAAEPAAA